MGVSKAPNIARGDTITQCNTRGGDALQQNKTSVLFLFKSHSFSMGILLSAVLKTNQKGLIMCFIFSFLCSVSSVSMCLTRLRP